ncbi:MAG: mechanosensitive ion channel family protein [Oscillospiraceae bacterium]|nr:mechanosensitive ion channel family protein [Oscillospiraceae bacterium]
MLEELKIWLATSGASLLAVVLKAIIIAVIGLFVIRAVNKLLDKVLQKSKLEKAAHSLLKGLAKTVLTVLLALIVASSLGVDVTGIVALASVLTLAVSLALQNMLANVIGGFTLLYTHPFSSGDYVEIAGQAGAVQEVGIAYTKLMTPDNKLISIPNSAVTAAQIVNYSASGCRRVDIDVSASYDAPTQLVIDTLVSTANASFVLTEPEQPYAVLVSYGESCINYTLRFWVKTEDYWAALFAVNQKIKADFDAAGVQMSYPHLNVHIEK